MVSLSLLDANELKDISELEALEALFRRRFFFPETHLNRSSFDLKPSFPSTALPSADFTV